MDHIGKLAKRTFQGMAGVTALYLGATLRDFSQLNDGISKVNTMYDQTAASQKKMMQDSINMFRMLPTDFQNITQGMYDSISAGADPKYAAILSRKFGMGAVAGITDIPVVTQAAMGTMNAFGKEVKDLDHILDVQFQTVKYGIVEYGQLASSLGTGVLKSAEGAGASIEELYAAIAQITKNAIPANIATTSLVQLFNKFTDTKAIKEFKNFGVEIQDAEKHTRPMVEILKDLNFQFDRRKMTGEQRKGYLKELLGSDEAARAIQPLLGDLKSFESIIKNMEGSSGAMMDAFDDRLNNFSTQMKLIWNSFKADGLEQLTALQPFFDALTGPLLEKQKLTLEKQGLEDLIDMEKDLKVKKALRFELEPQIKEIEAKIEAIDLTPIDKFKKGLQDGVNQLDKINPSLAKFVDILGNLTLNLVGEENETTRDNIKAVGAIAGFAYISKKIFDIAAKVSEAFGADESNLGESLTKTMKPMTIHAGVVNVYGKTSGLPTTTPVGGVPVNPIPTAGKGALDILKTGVKVFIPVAIAAGLVYTVKKAWDEDPQSFIDHAHREADRRSGGTKRNERQRNYPGKEDDTSVNSTLIRDHKNLVADHLMSSLKDMDNFNRNLSLQNIIQVESQAPKVNVQLAIDGKNIPFKATIDYEKVDRHQYRQSIRHGRTTKG